MKVDPLNPKGLPSTDFLFLKVDMGIRRSRVELTRQSLNRPSLSFVRQLAGHQYPIEACAFDNSRRQIVSSDGHTLRLWNFRKEVRRHGLAIEPGKKRGAQFLKIIYFSKFDLYLCACKGTRDGPNSYAGYILGFHPSLSPAMEFMAHDTFEICAMEADHRGGRVFTCDTAGHLYIWTILGAGDKIQVFRKESHVFTDLVSAIVLLNNHPSSPLAVAFEYGKVILYCSISLESLAEIQTTKVGLRTLTYVAESETISIGYTDGSVLSFLVILDSGKWTTELIDDAQLHTGSINDMKSIRHKNGVLSCGDDNVIRYWSAGLGIEFGRYQYVRNPAPVSDVPHNKVLENVKVSMMIPISLEIASVCSKQMVLVVTGELLTILELYSPCIAFTEVPGKVLQMETVPSIHPGLPCSLSKDRREISKGSYHFVLVSENQISVHDSLDGSMAFGFVPIATPEFQMVEQMNNGIEKIPNLASTRNISKVAYYMWSEIAKLHALGWSDGKVEFLDSNSEMRFQCVSIEALAAVTSIQVVQVRGPISKQIREIEASLMPPLGYAPIVPGSPLDINANSMSEGFVELEKSLSGLRLSDPFNWNKCRKKTHLNKPIEESLKSTSHRAFVGDAQGVMRLWDVENRNLLKTVAAHSGPILQIISMNPVPCDRYSEWSCNYPRKRCVVSVGKQGIVKVWSSDNLEMIGYCEVAPPAFSPERSRILQEYADVNMKESNSKDLSAIHLVPDSGILMCGFECGFICLCLVPLEGATRNSNGMFAHGRKVTSFASSELRPDIVLSSSLDQTIAIWQIKNHEPLQLLRRFHLSYPVENARFTKVFDEILFSHGRQISLLPNWEHSEIRHATEDYSLEQPIAIPVVACAAEHTGDSSSASSRSHIVNLETESHLPEEGRVTTTTTLGGYSDWGDYDNSMDMLVPVQVEILRSSFIEHSKDDGFVSLEMLPSIIATIGWKDLSVGDFKTVAMQNDITLPIKLEFQTTLEMVNLFMASGEASKKLGKINEKIDSQLQPKTIRKSSRRYSTMCTMKGKVKYNMFGEREKPVYQPIEVQAEQSKSYHYYRFDPERKVILSGTETASTFTGYPCTIDSLVVKLYHIESIDLAKVRPLSVDLALKITRQIFKEKVMMDDSGSKRIALAKIAIQLHQRYYGGSQQFASVICDRLASFCYSLQLLSDFHPICRSLLRFLSDDSGISCFAADLFADVLRNLHGVEGIPIRQSESSSTAMIPHSKKNPYGSVLRAFQVSLSNDWFTLALVEKTLYKHVVVTHGERAIQFDESLDLDIDEDRALDDAMDSIFRSSETENSGFLFESMKSLKSSSLSQQNSSLGSSMFDISKTVPGNVSVSSIRTSFQSCNSSPQAEFIAIPGNASLSNNNSSLQSCKSCPQAEFIVIPGALPIRNRKGEHNDYQGTKQRTKSDNLDAASSIPDSISPKEKQIEETFSQGMLNSESQEALAFNVQSDIEYVQVDSDPIVADEETSTIMTMGSNPINISDGSKKPLDVESTKEKLREILDLENVVEGMMKQRRKSIDQQRTLGDVISSSETNVKVSNDEAAKKIVIRRESLCNDKSMNERIEAATLINCNIRAYLVRTFVNMMSQEANRSDENESENDTTFTNQTITENDVAFANRTIAGSELHEDQLNNESSISLACNVDASLAILVESYLEADVDAHTSSIAFGDSDVPEPHVTENTSFETKQTVLDSVPVKKVEKSLNFDGLKVSNPLLEKVVIDATKIRDRPTGEAVPDLYAGVDKSFPIRESDFHFGNFERFNMTHEQSESIPEASKQLVESNAAKASFDTLIVSPFDNTLSVTSFDTASVNLPEISARNFTETTKLQDEPTEVISEEENTIEMSMEEDACENSFKTETIPRTDIALCKPELVSIVPGEIKRDVSTPDTPTRQSRKPMMEQLHARPFIGDELGLSGVGEKDLARIMEIRNSPDFVDDLEELMKKVHVSKDFQVVSENLRASVVTDHVLENSSLVFGDPISFSPLTLMKCGSSIPHWNPIECVDEESDDEFEDDIRSSLDGVVDMGDLSFLYNDQEKCKSPISEIEIAGELVSSWEAFFDHAAELLGNPQDEKNETELEAKERILEELKNSLRTEAGIETDFNGHIESRFRDIAADNVLRQLGKVHKAVKATEIASRTLTRSQINIIKNSATSVGLNSLFVDQQVDSGNIAYYKVDVSSSQRVLAVKIQCTKGEARLLLSKDAVPTFLDCHWQTEEARSVSILLFPNDPFYTPGSYYIAVHSLVHTSFSLETNYDEGICDTSSPLQNVEKLVEKFNSIAGNPKGLTNLALREFFENGESFQTISDVEVRSPSSHEETSDVDSDSQEMESEHHTKSKPERVLPLDSFTESKEAHDMSKHSDDDRSSINSCPFTDSRTFTTKSHKMASWLLAAPRSITYQTGIMQSLTEPGRRLAAVKAGAANLKRGRFKKSFDDYQSNRNLLEAVHSLGVFVQEKMLANWTAKHRVESLPEFISMVESLERKVRRKSDNKNQKGKVLKPVKVINNLGITSNNRYIPGILDEPLPNLANLHAKTPQECDKAVKKADSRAQKRIRTDRRTELLRQKLGDEAVERMVRNGGW